MKFPPLRHLPSSGNRPPDREAPCPVTESDPSAEASRQILVTHARQTAQFSGITGGLAAAGLLQALGHLEAAQGVSALAWSGASVLLGRQSRRSAEELLHGLSPEGPPPLPEATLLPGLVGHARDTARFSGVTAGLALASLLQALGQPDPEQLIAGLVWSGAAWGLRGLSLRSEQEIFDLLPQASPPELQAGKTEEAPPEEPPSP